MKNRRNNEFCGATASPSMFSVDFPSFLYQFWIVFKRVLAYVFETFFGQSLNDFSIFMLTLFRFRSENENMRFVS